MAKQKETIDVPTADAGSVTEKRYQQDHVTTQCFLRPVPVFAREKKAESDFRVTHEDFVRCDPMPVPTFGRAMVYDRAFFVPYRTIFKEWNDFIVSSPSYTANPSIINIAPSVPIITNKTLIDLLVHYSIVSAGSYDFKVLKSDNTTVQYVLSLQGIYVYKVLISLGYSVNFNESDTFEYSLLPLYAYMKVVMDWYYPSVYAMSSVYANVTHYFDCTDGVSNPMPLNTIYSFFDNCAYCSYNSDYFVSAWDNPTGPTAGLERSINMPDITSNSVPNGVTNNNALAPNPQNRPTNGTPFIGSTQAGNNYNTAITQYVIDTLRSLTDYTRRHQLVGVRAVDRYLAEYGINLSAEILKRSIYVGYNSFPLQFGDVMSHADTTSTGGDRLGDYAGKGVGYGHAQFSYDNKDEFGFFIIMNSIVPQVGMYQGVVRDVMHTTWGDFYHGDFDHQGSQAIYRREAGMGNDGSSNAANIANLNKSFGFISRYGEYACGFDRVSGLYRCNSRNLGLSSYYLMREFDFDSAAADPRQHDIDMMLATDYQNFNRIFYSDKDEVDFFNFVHHFEVSFNDTSRPLWESYDFEDAYKRIKENIGGTTVN